MKWTSPPHGAILVDGKKIWEDDTMNEDKTITPTADSAVTATMPPVANMDETDWTAMLMEMRIVGG